MQTEALRPAAATNFLTAVAAELADLADDDRADLLAPVHQRILELAPAAATREHLEELFGSPARLAEDLRAAAGLPDQPVGSPAAEGPPLGQWLISLARSRPVAPVVAYVASLRPAWWAARWFLLFAFGLAVLSRGGGYRLHTIGFYPQAFSRTDPHLSMLWLLGPVVAIIASIVLGLLGPRLPRAVQPGLVVVNVIAVFALVAWPSWWLGPAFAFYSGLVT